MTRIMSPDDYRIQSLQRQLTEARHLAGPRADSSRVVRVTHPEDWRGSNDGDAGVCVTDQSALGVSAFWANIRLRGSTIGSLPLPVYQKVNGVPIEARGTALWKVLHDSPNADQTPTDYWEFVSVSLDLRGSHFARIYRDARGELVALDPIRPDIVTVYRRSSGRLGYRWSWQGKSHDLDEAEVFHIRGFGGGPMGGLSTLQYARKSLGIAIAADRAAGNMFANGAKPSGALKFKDFLSEEDRAIARADLTEQFAGAANAGRPFILEGGIEWQQISLDADDAQLLQSRGWSVEDICRWFLTPPILVGHNEKTSSFGTGVAEIVAAWHKFGLNPTLRRIRQAIWKQLLTPQERAADFFAEHNVEGLLAATTKERYESYDLALKSKWRTINDVRRIENLPPVPWGDRPWGQQQDVQLDENGNLPTGEGTAE